MRGVAIGAQRRRRPLFYGGWTALTALLHMELRQLFWSVEAEPLPSIGLVRDRVPRDMRVRNRDSIPLLRGVLQLIEVLRRQKVLGKSEWKLPLVTLFGLYADPDYVCFHDVSDRHILRAGLEALTKVSTDAEVRKYLSYSWQNRLAVLASGLLHAADAVPAAADMLELQELLRLYRKSVTHASVEPPSTLYLPAECHQDKFAILTERNGMAAYADLPKLSKHKRETTSVPARVWNLDARVLAKWSRRPTAYALRSQRTSELARAVLKIVRQCIDSGLLQDSDRPTLWDREIVADDWFRVLYGSPPRSGVLSARQLSHVAADLMHLAFNQQRHSCPGGSELAAALEQLRLKCAFGTARADELRQEAEKTIAVWLARLRQSEPCSCPAWEADAARQPVMQPRRATVDKYNARFLWRSDAVPKELHQVPVERSQQGPWAFTADLRDLRARAHLQQTKWGEKMAAAGADAQRKLNAQEAEERIERSIPRVKFRRDLSPRSERFRDQMYKRFEKLIAEENASEA